MPLRKRNWISLAFTLLVAAQAAHADTTSAGHVYTPPEAFLAKRAGPVLTFTAPEGDASVVLVDLASAKDADDALAQAWKLVQPDVHLKLLTASPRPQKNGWVDQKAFVYETPPSEQRLVQAIARRAGQDSSAWVVLLMQGKFATLEKRGAPLSKFVNSLLPKGHDKESFSGRTPKPLTPQRIEQLKAFVADGMKQLGVPGVGLSFVQNGKTLWAGGLGVRELGKPEPIDADTLFMAASNTKAMTTALQARAVDTGKLRWDQPVVDAFPAFKLADAELTAQIQFRQLSCACTGIPRNDMVLAFADPLSPAKITFSHLAQVKPTSRVGEVFQYSNLMVSAAGYIAATVLKPDEEFGKAYDDAMSQEFFVPLGMTRTTFDFAKAKSANHASPHGNALDGSTKPIAIENDTTVIPFRPAGGVWTTPRDFSRWVEMELAHGRKPDGSPLITEANWAERYKPQIMVGEGVSYGMGLMIDRQLGVTVATHGGDISGFHSNMLWLPDFGIGATILTNADGGELLRGPFQRKLMELLFDGKPEADEQLKLAASNRKNEFEQQRKELTLPVSGEALSKLAGAYRNTELGTFKVERTKGVLRFVGAHWSSEVALRRNEDGSQSYVTIDAGMEGAAFYLDRTVSPAVLTLRDAQHEYRFTPHEDRVPREIP